MSKQESNASTLTQTGSKGAGSTAGQPARSSESASVDLRFNFRRTPTDGSHKPETTRRWRLVRLDNEGCVDVVGESNYQPALEAITGREDWVEVRHECTAVLVLEPSNPYDPNAVRVEIKGRLVGYLSRADAVSYGPYLRELAKDRRLPCCQALISGRGQGSQTRNMGVFLYMAPPGPELLAGCSPVRRD
jgi:hypothetical protein